MLKSILTTALRNIFRNRTFSLINMIGLSVSMSLGLLIILVIREQYTYDRFHEDKERIYRVNTRALRVSGGSEPYASAPLPIATVLENEYEFTESVVRVNMQLNSDAVYGNVNVPVSGLFVDPSFLTVFNFPLLKGNAATALREPNSLILTAQAAEKIFGSTDPLGLTLTLPGYGEFTVTGVLEKIKNKTHFEFEVLGSTAALPAFEKQGIVLESLDNWNNYYAGLVYIKLREGRSPSEVEAALAKIAKANYAELKLETRDKGYEFYMQPLLKITPGPELSNQMGRGLPDLLLIFLGVLAAVVMLMSCLNFTNLMIAKSLSRAREIGVRKIVGAQRLQVFFQFVGEAVVFSLFALLISYVLMQFLKTGFQQLPFGAEFALELNEDFVVFGLFFLFAVGVGIVAGLLPALYLSAFKPVSVLKDASSVKFYSRLTFRKILMTTQYTFSVIFVIVVLVIYQQITFMVSSDYGINQKDILNVRLQGVAFDRLANEMAKFPGVINVGGVSHKLGTWQDGASDYKRNRHDEPFVMRDFVVDENYVRNLDLQFIAGTNFDNDVESASGRHVIVNEKALTGFGFGDAVSAIGETVYYNDSVPLRVIGVVKDFHFRPLNVAIGPLAFRQDKSELQYLSAKINSDNKALIVASLESVWKQLDPVHPLEWMMMEEEIDQAYLEAGMHDLLIIVGYITFLTVVLACLGMLGMAMYSTQTRRKEVGVRKVMGAGVWDVVFLLSKSFILMIVVALFIGIPVSYFLGQQFLNLYAYKIEITGWLLLSGASFIVALGCVIVSSQTIHAAASNPVKSLRYE